MVCLKVSGGRNMGRKGKAGNLPSWYKGQKYRCDIGGEEIFGLDGSSYFQRDLRVSKENYDDLTDLERENQKRRNI